MKKLVLPIAMAFMMSPMLNAADTTTDCRAFAEEAADAEWGDTVQTDAEYFEAFAEWYGLCEDLN